MTTIAMCGDYIAADGQSTAGSVRITHDSPKLFKNSKRKTIYAVTGLDLMARPSIAWFEAGAKPADHPRTPDGDEWSLWVVTKDRIVRYSHANPYGDCGWSAPFAAGTGGSFALGAMLAGANAMQAVLAATKIDTLSGGNIVSIKLRDFFGGAGTWPALLTSRYEPARVCPDVAVTEIGSAAKAPRHRPGYRRKAAARKRATKHAR